MAIVIGAKSAASARASSSAPDAGRAWLQFAVQNGGVLLLIGIGLAIFVVPAPWNIPIVILFGLLEIVETSWAWRRSRRGESEGAPKEIIGATGRAVTDCRPSGTVRVHAAMWQGRCEAGVDGGKRIRVIGKEEQTLIVEPIE